MLDRYEKKRYNVHINIKEGLRLCAFTMKTVLITGGSRGIGAETVRKFSELGYSVAFTYLSSEREALALAEECRALAIRADVRSEQDAIGAVRRVVDTYDSIDVLVNNAGISSHALFTDLSLAEWEDMLRVNLTGAFLFSREALKYMIREHRGAIVNVSSMWGLVGASCEVHYSTAKAALIGMTRALAKEVGPSGITVNAIAPGVIDTDMNRNLSAEDIDVLRGETPLCRLGTAREIAEAIAFLSSDAASFITGETLNASGGFVIG